MKTPKPLHKGDKIGLVATARKISREELEPAISVLQNWGFRPVEAPNIYKENHQFAGTDKQRLSDIQQFINDPEIKAILCVRGGYGTVRIIDQINFNALQKQPKWICGYSDITVLHNTLSKLGIESLHSSMPVNFKTNTKEALESFRKALTGEALYYKTTPHPFNRTGKAEGILTGGNLSMLYSQTGSPSALDTKGKILFIEDLDEYLYHIDRMMQNLKRNDYFESLSAVIIGGMNDMNDNQIPFGQTAEEIIRNFFKEYDYPVCFGFPAGHIDNNLTLPFGKTAKLSITDESITLQFNGQPQ